MKLGNVVSFLGKAPVFGGKKYCAYCGINLRSVNGHKRETQDHIRPQASGGVRKERNLAPACQKPDFNDRSNGRMRCQEKKGNTPLIEYLEGAEGQYDFQHKYETSDTSSKQHVREYGVHVGVHKYRTFPKVDAKELRLRAESFSDFMVNRILNCDTNHRKPNWFLRALDNLVYPVWGLGKKPRQNHVLSRMYQERTKTLLQKMASVEPVFWLHKPYPGRQTFAEKVLEPGMFESSKMKTLKRMLRRVVEQLRVEMNFKEECSDKAS